MINPFETKKEVVNTSPIISDEIKKTTCYMCACRCGINVHLKDGKICLVGLVPDSQRYFDYHHAPTDIFENVNKRELELGAAALTSFIFLIDKYGFQQTEFNQ